MTKWTVALATGAALALCAAGPAAHAQNQFPDIAPGHWAFQAVEDLARAGLVLGYPDGNFLGNRSLTRYEMATLVKRIVDNLAGRPPAAGGAPEGVTTEQLAEVRRLVDELKVELAVIGTDMAAVRTRLDALDQRQARTEQRLGETEKTNAAQQAALDVLNRKRIDGYVQARYTERATGDPARAPENVAQDTTRGNSGNRSTFQIRRARVNIRGNVSPRTSYRVQVDARTAPSAGADEITVKEAYVTIRDFPVRMQTAQADRKPFATMDLTLGQQVTPFGYYLQFSSADRESPERYIAFSDTGSGLFPSQDYDKGVSLNGLLLGRYQYQLGIYNGNGTASNDLGRRKDFIGRVGVTIIPNRWSLGVSGYDGEGFTTGTTVVIDPANSATFIGSGATRIPVSRRRVKSLVGVDTQYTLPFGDLKIEYVRGKGGLSGAAQNVVPSALRPYVDAAVVEGYYAQLGVNLGARARLIGAYEYFNRNADPADSGPFSTFNGLPVSKNNFAEERAHFGGLYFLDAATRLRLWYEAPLNYPNPPGGGESLGRTGFYTAEVQVKF